MMRIPHLLLSLSLLLGLAISTWAEPPEGPRPDGRPAKDGMRRGGGGPGGAHGREGKRRSSPGKYTEMSDRILDHLQETEPAVAAKLRKLRSEDPDAFREALRQRMAKRMGARPEGGKPHKFMMPPNPEMREAGEVIRRALIAYHADQSEANQAALRSAVAAQFDLRMDDRGKHIEKLEAVLAKMKEEREQHLANRDEAIDRDMERILNAKAGSKSKTP